MSRFRKSIILEIADRKGSLPLLEMAGIIAMGGRAATVGRLPAGIVGSATTVGSGVACFSSLPIPAPPHKHQLLPFLSFYLLTMKLQMVQTFAGSCEHTLEGTKQ